MLHEAIRKNLIKTAESGDIFSALILSGPEGIGKRTIAREFAAAIHCEAESGRPCGVCPSCVKHKTGNHPDYFELTAEPGKKNISVSAVRSACENLFIKPLISDRKILFIPEADLCEAPAQNAMLKCFEEPPPYAVIILAVRDLSALLDTIKSRAAIIPINPEPEEGIRSFVKENYPDSAKNADFIAAFSCGIVKKAVLLSENAELSEKRAHLLSLLSSFSKSRLAAIRAADFLSENQDGEEFLYELTSSYFRDAAALKCGGKKLINSDFSSQIRAFSSSHTKKQLVSALSLLAYAKNDKSKNANYGLFTEDLLLRLWEVLHD